MAAEPPADLPPLGSRTGMLPPDGTAWPAATMRAEPGAAPDPVLHVVAPRPPGDVVQDWRAMAVDVAPDGYQGTAGAPRPVARWDGFCIAALVVGVGGLLGYFLPAFLAVAAGVLGVALGLAGRHATRVDPSRRGRWLAHAGMAAALVMPVYHGLHYRAG